MQSCRHCPDHAVCFDDQVQCDAGYLKRKNWLLREYCVPDTLKSVYVDKLLADVEYLVSLHTGSVECNSQLRDTVWMQEQDVHQKIRQMYRDDVREDGRFADYWDAMMLDLLKSSREQSGTVQVK